MRGFVTDSGAPGGLRLADELPEPEPQADELLIEVRAYGVNRGETFLIQQRPDGWQPGQDVAGVVSRPAADGSGPPAGSRMVGIVDGAGWSERVALPSSEAAALPDEVGFSPAAALPIAGLTALRALRVGGSLLGRRVLITGATGGVGQFAVQLAALAGAEVTAQVSAEERGQQARDLGAHAVTTDLSDEALGGFDLVLDGIGGQALTDSVHRLAPGGTVATYGTLGGPGQLGLLDFSGANGPLGSVVGLFHAYPLETRGIDLGGLVGLVAQGRLDPLLGVQRDWEGTVEVLEGLRRREIRGKAVLTLPDSAGEATVRA